MPTLEEGEFETVAGRILHELGELPAEGAVIALGGFSFTVEEVEGNRLKTLAVRADGGRLAGGRCLKTPAGGEAS